MFNRTEPDLRDGAVCSSAFLQDPVERRTKAGLILCQHPVRQTDGLMKAMIPNKHKHKHTQKHTFVLWAPEDGEEGACLRLFEVWGHQVGGGASSLSPLFCFCWSGDENSWVRTYCEETAELHCHPYSVCVCVCVCTMCVWNSGTLWCSRCFRRRGPVGGARPWKLRLYSVSTGTGFFLKGGTDLLLEWSSCRGVKGHLHQSVKSKSRELNESLNHFNNSIQVSSVTQQPAVIIDQLFFSWGEPAHKQSAAPLWTCSWTTGV